MTLLLLEALAALAVLALIVWWTMFSGRSKGERDGARRAEREGEATDEPPGGGSGPDGGR